MPDNYEATIQEILNKGTSCSTRRAYQRDLVYFWAWADIALNKKAHYPVDEEWILRFIAEHLGRMPRETEDELISRKVKTRHGALRVNTIRRYLASLSVAHQVRGQVSPVGNPAVKMLLRRGQKSQSTGGPRKVAAITANVLRHMLAACDNSLRSCEYKALLLVGFCSGGRRRDELVNLKYSDLAVTDQGYLLTIRDSKTDVKGAGYTVPVAGEAALALTAWLHRSGITQGYLFRSIVGNDQVTGRMCGRTVNRIVKRLAVEAGYDPNEFGAHSLRAGFITEATRQNIPLRDAMALSGHRTIAVAAEYTRAPTLQKNPAANLLQSDTRGETTMRENEINDATDFVLTQCRWKNENLSDHEKHNVRKEQVNGH